MPLPSEQISPLPPLPLRLPAFVYLQAQPQYSPSDPSPLARDLRYASLLVPADLVNLGPLMSCARFVAVPYQLEERLVAAVASPATVTVVAAAAVVVVAVGAYRSL